MAARPAGRCAHQRRTGPPPAPAAADEHPQLAEAVPADLKVEHPDDLAIGNRHNRLACAAHEERSALADVDWWLGCDAITFLSH
jgi:hypothetical protein